MKDPKSLVALIKVILLLLCG